MMTLGLQEYSPVTRWSLAFMALHAAAEGCFIPFLTIYFRQLGLPSSYIGILLGIRVSVATIFGPLWRHLSRKFGRQKILVLLSILAGIVLRIGLSLVLPISTEYLLEYCADMPGEARNNYTTPQYHSATITSVTAVSQRTPTPVHLQATSNPATDPEWGAHQNSSRIERDAIHDDGYDPDGSVVPLFLTVMMVLVVGELFSTCGFQLVRVSLYHHLDNTDNFNLFPIAMSVWTVCGGLSAAVISGAVDQAPCIILDGRSSMVIQFACSAVILLMTFAVSVFLPLFEPHSLLQSSSRSTKALGFLCSDVHHVLLAANSIAMGVLTSASSGFLFWYLQDLGGTEFSMGFFLLVESFSQCVVRLKSVALLRKLGHVWVSGLNFGCLAVSYLYFAAIWNSWLTPLVGLIRGLGLTLFWKAISDSLEETAPPGLYLLMFKHLEGLYAVGLAVGYVSVGFLGGVIRFKFVFVIFGVLASFWAVVSCLTMHFFPRKENVRYAKLFESQGDGPGSADESGEDWLGRDLGDEEEL